MQSKKPNWIKIQTEYESSNISYKKLAEKYNISENTIEARARREKWNKGKTKITEKITEKIREKTVKKISDRNTKHLQLWDKLLSKIEKVIDEELNKGLSLNGELKELSLLDVDKIEQVSKVLEKIQAGHRKAENIIDEKDLRKLKIDEEKLEIEKEKLAMSKQDVDIEQEDDGFIEALNDTAQEVWADGSNAEDNS